MNAAPGAPRIAPMEPVHLPQVFEIEARACAFPWTPGNFRDALAAGYSSWVLLGDGARVVGYALLSLAAGEAQLLNLCIDPAQQRRGLGRRLMAHLLHLARAAHCELMLLEVRESNAPAIALYESLGFNRIGLRKNYYRAAGGAEHALVMSRQLCPWGES